jgi:predicted Rossmann-fold nucleotide-binding protein
LILFGKQFWGGLLRWLKSEMQDKNQFISRGDLDLFTVTDSEDEALDVIMDYVHRVGPPETVPKAFA